MAYFFCLILHSHLRVQFLMIFV